LTYRWIFIWLCSLLLDEVVSFEVFSIIEEQLLALLDFLVCINANPVNESIIGMHRISGQPDIQPDIRPDNPIFFISGIQPDTAFPSRISGRISGKVGYPANV
jgi:hypothetical protein